MNSEDYIESTKEVLLTTFKYCEENNFRFWTEEHHNNQFIFKIGEDEDYFSQMDKLKANPYSYKNISEVNESMIYHTPFDMFQLSENIDCAIQFNAGFAKRNPQKYNEFYVAFFFNHGKELTKVLHKRYANANLDLSYIIGYKTEKYPNGFYDNKVFPYTSGINWRHFLDTFFEHRLAECWENDKKFKNFTTELKKLNPLLIHSTLNNLTERLVEFGLSEDSMFKTSYMLMDVLDSKYHDFYAKRFPLMKSLIEKIKKDSLFPETENEIIERAIFPKIHLYQYFSSDKFNPSQYSDLASEVLTNIKNNIKLEEKGLISAEVTGIDDISIYMVLKPDSLVNKSSIKPLFIQIIESFINHPDMMIEEKATLLRDKCDLTLIQKISDTIIDKWILEKELAVNQNEKSSSKKLKKV